MKLWRIWGLSICFHDVLVSTFKFGGNRRFFGVDTADFVWCRGGTRAIRLPVVCDIHVSDVNVCAVERLIARFGFVICYILGVMPKPKAYDSTKDSTV